MKFLLHDNTNKSAKNKLLGIVIIKQLENLLRIVLLLDDNLEVIKVDKITIKKEKNKNAKESINSITIRQIGIYEARLELIHKTLQSIMDVVNIYDIEGNIRRSYGFKLKNLEDWVTDSKIDPYHGNIEWDVLKYLSQQCAVECEFCLHKSDPPEYYTNSCKWEGNLNEIEERVKYFEPSMREALFSEFTYGSYEKISHPKFFDILDKVRNKSQLPIMILTNGRELDDEKIYQLKKYWPAAVLISLNSTSEEVRREAMNDSNPYDSIKTLKTLKKEEVPFIVSLTHWYKSSLEELSETIEYVDKYSPCLIRINLEGYSKYHPLYRHYNLIDHWNKIVKAVRKVREKIETPIVFQPVLYEETLNDEELTPIVKGVTKNSPAYFSRLKQGDTILKISNKSVTYRKTVKDVLYFLQDKTDKISLEIKRGNEKIQVEISKKPDLYPYFKFYEELGMGYPWGIVLADSLDPLAMKDFFSIIKEYRNVLLLTSYLVKSSFKKMFDIMNENIKIQTEVHVAIPKNGFLGEELIIGDLLTVDDFIVCVKEWINNNKIIPETIIIPSTPFSVWGKDITGKSLRHIQRELEIPVKILKTDKIWSLGG